MKESLKSKLAKIPILAWMQPEANKRRQILTSVYVPLQRGIPLPLAAQLQAQQFGKVLGLVRDAVAQEPAALDDFLSRLDSLGLLPYEAQEAKDLSHLVTIILDGEIMTYLKPDTTGLAKDPEEIPGARELMREITLYDWMKALDEEVTGQQ